MHAFGVTQDSHDMKCRVTDKFWVRDLANDVVGIAHSFLCRVAVVMPVRCMRTSLVNTSTSA